MVYQKLLLSLAAVPLLYVVKVVIDGFTSPLAKIPGTWHSRFTKAVIDWEMFRGRRVQYILSLHQKYGPIVRSHPNEVLVATPEGFAQIHRAGSNFNKAWWYDDVLGGPHAMLSMRDPIKHGRRRKLFARPFSNSSLRANWEAVVREKIQLAVASIKREAGAGRGDVYKWWTLMSSDIICTLSFGTSPGSLEAGKKTEYTMALEYAVIEAFVKSQVPFLNLIAWLVPLPGLKRLTTSLGTVQKYGSLAVDTMRSTEPNKDSLFRQIITQWGDDERPDIADVDVGWEAASLSVAGTDTTGVTLTYFVWAVLRRPALQRRLEDEAARLGAELALEDLEPGGAAPLLNAVLHETLRLYGPVPGSLAREVPSGGTTVGGYFVPGGRLVTTNAYALHRDPKIWPNPLEFDETRFMDMKTLTWEQKTSFCPFGGGSRICIGINLAWMELRLAAVLFLRECRGARLTEDMTEEEMDIDHRFVNFPKGHRCDIAL